MEPDTLEELKSVLSTISDIREMSMEVLFKLDDTHERYRTLRMYKAEIPEEEEKTLEVINNQWDELLYRSKCVDVELTPIKRQFTILTKEEIGQFKDEMAVFTDKFETEGPSTVGEDLDKGFQLMKSFQAEISKYEKSSAELSNAEKLFGLEVTPYPRLVKAKQEMESLAMVYDLYERQMNAREEWGATLWSCLNVDSSGFLKLN